MISPYILIAYLVGFTILNGLIAQEKHRDVPWTILGSVLGGGLFVYLYLLAVPSKS